MDDANDNIFATGNSGPSGDVANSGGKSTGASDGVAGRIDPVIARATANTPGDRNNGNDIGNTARDPGKRGRHPAACECERCTAKRAGQPIPPAEPKGEARNLRASFIEKTLYSIHLGIVAITKAPEFELDKDDAKKLGEAVAGVLAFHKVKISPKQEAYALLVEAAAQVYPPMIVSLYLRKKMEAEEAKKRRHNGGPPLDGHRVHLRPVPDEPRPTIVPNPAPPPPNTGGFDPGKITLD